MSFLSRGFSKRFLASAASNRVHFPPVIRSLSSSSDDGNQKPKKVGFSSLLGYLKTSDKEADISDNKDITEQLKRNRVYSAEEISKNIDEDLIGKRQKAARKAVLDAANRKLREERGPSPWAPEGAGYVDSAENLVTKAPPAFPRASSQTTQPTEVNAADTLSAFRPMDHDPELDGKLKSILSQLKVDTTKNQLSRDIIGAVQGWGSKTHTRYRTDIVKDYKEQSKPLRKPVEPISLTSGDRITLFDEVFEGKSVKSLMGPPEKLFLTEQEKLDRIVDFRNLDYRNDFESLIEIADWQWKFPIDNEVCKIEEIGVGFEEHVFLGYLLEEFPKKGPVRQFMELVISGLEQNAHLSVKQKKGQVAWFKDYFEKIPAEELTF